MPEIPSNLGLYHPFGGEIRSPDTRLAGAAYGQNAELAHAVEGAATNLGNKIHERDMMELQLKAHTEALARARTDDDTAQLATDGMKDGNTGYEEIPDHDKLFPGKKGRVSAEDLYKGGIAYRDAIQKKGVREIGAIGGVYAQEKYIQHFDPKTQQSLSQLHTIRNQRVQTNLISGINKNLNGTIKDLQQNRITEASADEEIAVGLKNIENLLPPEEFLRYSNNLDKQRQVAPYEGRLLRGGIAEGDKMSKEFQDPKSALYNAPVETQKAIHSLIHQYTVQDSQIRAATDAEEIKAQAISAGNAKIDFLRTIDGVTKLGTEADMEAHLNKMWDRLNDPKEAAALGYGKDSHVPEIRTAILTWQHQLRQYGKVVTNQDVLRDMYIADDISHFTKTTDLDPYRKSLSIADYEKAVGMIRSRNHAEYTEDRQAFERESKEARNILVGRFQHQLGNNWDNVATQVAKMAEERLSFELRAIRATKDPAKFREFSSLEAGLRIYNELLPAVQDRVFGQLPQLEKELKIIESKHPKPGTGEELQMLSLQKQIKDIEAMRADQSTKRAAAKTPTNRKEPMTGKDIEGLSPGQAQQGEPGTYTKRAEPRAD